jgi:hypothetical protein
VIDVANDPGGREKLLALGVRNVPVVAKGENYVFGQNLEDVAEFVGLQGTGHKPLPPDQLIKKWVMVLRALQRYARQLPSERLEENVIPNRPRSIRLLTHHAFRIADAYLDTVEKAVEYSVGQAPGKMVGGREGQDAVGEDQDLLRHAADRGRIRAIDLALCPALQAARRRPRALQDPAGQQAHPAGPGGVAAPRAPVRIDKPGRQDFPARLRHWAGDSEYSRLNARAKAISDS